MGEPECEFELAREPKARLYVGASAWACLGFWFFDYAVRGWLGGTPNLAVSLRHTFIIAVCLGFVVGFLLRDGRRTLTLSREGLALVAGGAPALRMSWPEIEKVAIEGGNLVCYAEGRSLAIPVGTASSREFADCLATLAGPEHPLTLAVRAVRAP